MYILHTVRLEAQDRSLAKEEHVRIQTRTDRVTYDQMNKHPHPHPEKKSESEFMKATFEDVDTGITSPKSIFISVHFFTSVPSFLSQVSLLK